MAGLGGDADGNIDLTVDQSMLQPDLVRGLANTGNTCFLNSTLQAVAPLGSVHEWMRSILVAGVQARLHQLQNAEARRLGSVAGVHAGAATPAGLDAAGDDGTADVWHSIGATTAKLLGILRALNWPLHSSGAEVGVGRSSNSTDNATGGGSALGKLAAFAGAAASALLDSAATAPLVPRLALGQLSSFFESQGGQQHDAHELFLIMISSIEDGDRDSVLQAVAEVRRKQRWLMAAMTVYQPPSVRRTGGANPPMHTQVPQVEVGFTTPVKGGLGKTDGIDHHGRVNNNSMQIQKAIASSRRAWARAVAAAAASRQRTGGSSRPRDASASAAVGARSTMAGSRIGGYEDLCGGGSISLSNPFTCIVGRRTECLACREATLIQQQQQRSPSSSAASSGGIGQGSSGGGGDMISAWTLSSEVSLTLNPPDPHSSMMMAGFGGGGGGSMPTTTTSIEMLLRQYFSSNPTSGWLCSNPACSHVAHASRIDRMTGREVLLNRILEHNALRRTVLFACPPVLNLHISRLQPGYKNSSHVRFDLVLDLKPYTLQGHFGSAQAAAAESATHGVGRNTSKSSVSQSGVASATGKGKGTSASTSTTNISTSNSTTMYDLMSCIVHLGGPYSGHYITYRRVPCVVQLQRTTSAGAAAALSQDAPTQTGWQWEKGSSRHPKVWVLCSDSDVQALGEKQQQQRHAESTVGGGGGDAHDDGLDDDDSGSAGGEDADETGSGSVRHARAYMLFYARRDTLRLPEPHGVHEREAAAAGNGSKSSGRAQSRLSSPGAPAAGLVLGTRDSHGAKWGTDAAARVVLASQTRALHGHATAAMAEELTASRMLMLHPLELATAGKRGGWDATSTSEIESAGGSFNAMVCWYPPAGKLQ